MRSSAFRDPATPATPFPPPPRPASSILSSSTPRAIIGTTLACLFMTPSIIRVNFASSSMLSMFGNDLSSSYDSAYQSRTARTCALLLSPSGRFSSSATRCASRTGSSLCRNCALTMSCRWIGCAPKSIMYFSETPVWFRNDER